MLDQQLDLVNVSLHLPLERNLSLQVKPYRDMGVSVNIAMSQIWEPYNTMLLLSLLQSGDTFLDIGAHVGYFSVIAAEKVGHNGKVYAFEPEPENAAILRYNLQQNDFDANSQVFELAVGDNPGAATLYRASVNHGAHQLDYPYRDGVDTEGVTVSTVALDYFAETVGINCVNCIKMDVQGYEVKALRGMKGLIEQNREHLVMLLEFSPTLLCRFDAENAGTEAFIQWIEANVTSIFLVKRTLSNDNAAGLIRINVAKLYSLAEYLTQHSDVVNEDACADLCCVFSETAAEKFILRAGRSHNAE